MAHYRSLAYARFPKLPHFIALARLNGPIGIYLLLWPTLWGLWFAAGGWPGWHLLLVFVLGTVLTRSAGCVMNDIADRDFDGRVKRTRNRPLAQGALTVEAAVVFMACLLFAALILVLTTNWMTVGIAVLAAIIAGVYPFMKRYTYLPQAILGVAFSMGIPMAFAATSSSIPKLAWLLVIANLLWTVAYDTAYAMVDRDDDLKLGIRSSAILFGDMDKTMIAVLDALFVAVMILAGTVAESGIAYYAGLLVASVLFVWHQVRITDRARDACFAVFLGNHWVGFWVFAGVALDFALGH
ncbi:MAG: 4-hydroxybenzoate octaprenyltransferase [Pseudomonadales bacterium]|nr:4-hydroxybenzoate octaprenyltransferase [Pseudomonadales bacterium]